MPLGEVRLLVTFGTQDNYRTELIDFDVAHINLSYNAILGYPALAKFMAVTHHAYNIVKIPGCSNTITIRSDEKDSVRTVVDVYKVMAATYPADEDTLDYLAPTKKKQYTSQEKATAKKAAAQRPAEAYPVKSYAAKAILAKTHPKALPATGAPSKAPWIRSHWSHLHRRRSPPPPRRRPSPAWSPAAQGYPHKWQSPSSPVGGLARYPPPGGDQFTAVAFCLPANTFSIDTFPSVHRAEDNSNTLRV